MNKPIELLIVQKPIRGGCNGPFLNFPFHWRHKPKIKKNAHKYIMSRNEKWHVGRACCKLHAFINGATFSLLDFCL